MATPSRYPVERSPFGPSGDAALSPRLLHLSSGKAWKVRDLTQWIRAVPPAELVAKLTTSEEYINMDSFLERLSAATLDDKARITAKDRFTNAQSPKAWSMSTSLPPANALPKHTCVVPLLLPSAGTRIKQGRTSEITQDHELARTIGDGQSLRYNTVPEVTVLDTDDHDFWKVSWHLAHDLPAAGMWEVGFHIRAYKSAARRKVGYGVVLESLDLHGKAPASTLTSPVPIKRKLDYLAGLNFDFK
ncbi:hypothetical protein A4X13_0g7143 [Tilletia indica]|uniref:Uncharacterized protein n=1 Tax=Tilletia indica TaxID=43049 RepID=A0A177T6N3_9BASI|nr:hypothetical protein A4X13_0g7143 [Tilletia indica]